jgi:hypothetical protein
MFVCFFFTFKITCPHFDERKNRLGHTALPPRHTHTRKGKGKAVPLEAWSGPEGSRKLKFPDFMTTVQDGGKVVSLKHRTPLPPGDTRGTHLC